MAVTYTVKSADVMLTQTVTLPNWVDSGSASPQEQSAWNQGQQTLKAHELGHVDINRSQAEKLDKSLPGTSGTGIAPTTKTAATEAQKRVAGAIGGKVKTNVAETNRQQQQYDKRTDHGRKQEEQK